jgi:hypothetical protein
MRCMGGVSCAVHLHHWWPTPSLSLPDIGLRVVVTELTPRGQLRLSPLYALK